MNLERLVSEVAKSYLDAMSATKTEGHNILRGLENDNEQKKLEFLYGQLVSMLQHEGRFVSERFTHFITIQAFLFAGYFLVATTTQVEFFVRNVLFSVISLLGIITTVSYAFMMARTIMSITFWRSSLVIIEDKSSFWPSDQKSKFADLDLFSARLRSVRGIRTEQHTNIVHLSKRSRLLASLSLAIRDPHDFYGIYFPLLFISAWTILIITPILGPVYRIISTP